MKHPTRPVILRWTKKTKEIHLTEKGFQRAENSFSDAKAMGAGSLYDAVNLILLHHLNAALKARFLFLRDRDYVVQNGQVIIVDEFTGRLMPGRRWETGNIRRWKPKKTSPSKKKAKRSPPYRFRITFVCMKNLPA